MKGKSKKREVGLPVGRPHVDVWLSTTACRNSSVLRSASDSSAVAHISVPFTSSAGLWFGRPAINSNRSEDSNTTSIILALHLTKLSGLFTSFHAVSMMLQASSTAGMTTPMLFPASVACATANSARWRVSRSWSMWSRVSIVAGLTTSSLGFSRINESQIQEKKCHYKHAKIFHEILRDVFLENNLPEAKFSVKIKDHT